MPLRGAKDFYSPLFENIVRIDVESRFVHNLVTTPIRVAVTAIIVVGTATIAAVIGLLYVAAKLGGGS